MNLNSKPFRISSISDIHLFNKRNTTSFIINNLNKYFSCDEHLASIDMVIFGGDVFDDLISLSDEDVGLIDFWIVKFLILCNKYNVLVRILEGTPSHDRQQSERFRVINEIYCNCANVNVDLKYVKTLSVEHIDRFDIDVLYVPDEWNHLTETTLNEVKELFKAKDIAQVDFAFMHGAFKYQLGTVVKDNVKHDEEEYLALVKHLIFIGHIHNTSNRGRIYANGSFDRLAHGEESPKGFLSAIVNTDGTYEIKFIENTTARNFITIACKNEDIEINLKLIDKKVKKLPPESFVRIEANYKNIIINSLDTLKRRWPLLNWSMLPKDVDSEEEKAIFSEDLIYSSIVIDSNTLIPLLTDRINKLNVNPDIFDRCLLHLKDLK